MTTGRLLISLVLLVFLTGCTGSGQSGQNNTGIGLSALILPEKVSVVDPKSSGGGSSKALAAVKSLMTGITGTDLSLISPPTDYQADQATVYVNERSLEAFNIVNDILCSLRQTKYEVMLNKGPYRAQVDKNLCNSKRDSASSGGEAGTNQSSGAGMPDYEEWIVSSYRPSALSPHIVDLWVHSTDGPSGKPQPILARVLITEGSDTAPPYGIFKINFKALDPGDNSTVVFKAFLNAERNASGKILLKFMAEDTNSYFTQKATLYKSAFDTGSGSVYTAMSYTWMPETSLFRFNISYNGSYFRRDETGGSSVCLDRFAYDVSAWKYGLYTAAAPIGTRINLNAGFTIKKDNAYGWIGYWGAWMPNGVVLNNNDDVFKHDYGTNSDTRYTVIKAGGKLKKHTKHRVTLAEIKNVPLIFWDQSGNAYQVVWDGSAMKIVAVLASNTQTWQNFAAPFPLNALSWYELGFWSQSLSGMVIVKFPPPLDLAGSLSTASNCGYDFNLKKYNCTATATDNVPVIYFEENIVYPDDAIPATLACFENCPDIANLSTNSPFRSDISSYQTITPQNAARAEYHFDPANMLLYFGATGTTPVVTSSTGTNFTNGVTSGPLFDPAILTAPSATIPSPLGCDWDLNTTCGGKAWSVLDVFYTWETGPNDWNKFTGLKDLAGIVKFDKPLQVRYVHHAPLFNPTPADTKYDNVTFFLEYNGFGNLSGIPGKCVNMDSGADADCTNGGNSVRWVPEFTIPDIQPAGSPAAGELTELVDVAKPSQTYMVKALEKEERMRAAGAENCKDFQITEYQLPQMDAYKDPALGPEPTVNAAPAVIGGVVQ